MHPAFAALIAAAADATPSPTPIVNPDLVTPGPGGFVAMAFVGIAAIVLVWDMMRRIRRARIRLEVSEDLDAELNAERGDAAPGDTAPGDTAEETRRDS